MEKSNCEGVAVAGTPTAASATVMNVQWDVKISLS
jgi:hypothetical protein